MHYSKHSRSPSTDSTTSTNDHKDLSPVSPLSATTDNRRHSFEIVESVEEIKIAEKSEVFEQQLAQLQEQLVSSMIENQNMAAELTTLRNDKQVQTLEKELTYERKKNNELVVKITNMAQLATKYKNLYTKSVSLL